jgi:DNA-binding transcriptional LysR family regulator
VDTVLVKTFLEVVACNSFAAAADKLFVSQSAVSLRIKSLESHLGRPVFIRSKAGVTITPAGRRLMRHAASFLQVWEEARQQVAVPEEFEDVIVVAAESGLWERFLIRWLPLLAERLPHMAFRAEEGKSINIVAQMISGITDIAVLYTPQLRPGLEISYLFDEDLILVSTHSSCTTLEGDYVFVDWGEEFGRFHTSAFPDSEHPRVTFKLGQVTLNYLLNNGGSAFMPRRLVQPFIDAGKLIEIETAASFKIPVHLVWRTGIKHDALKVVHESIKEIVEQSVSNTLPKPFWVAD